jgi:predicted HAD superfamily Cof-like phosphohydrolase
MSGNIEAHDYLGNVRETESFKIPLAWYMPQFMADIDKMNAMYRMPVVEVANAVEVETRLAQFKKILLEEVNEIDDIKVKLGHHVKEHLIPIADLLGDIIVYCASEAKRWGIPIDRVLHIIMQSNFSKLDVNGQPIYDERMKLMKGPNYWKPEPKIEQMLIEWNGRSE